MQGIRSSYANPESDRAAFLAWHGEGTILKASRKLKNDGVVSSRGTPFTPDGVRKAAVRYMINNYSEAKASFIEAYDRYGYAVDEAFIEKLLIKFAVSSFKNAPRVKHWLIKNNLIDRHKLFIQSLITL